MRRLDSPDWGYFGAAWGVIAVGLGFVLMSGDTELYAHLGRLLVVLGVALLCYSLRPAVRSLLNRHNPLAPRIVLQDFHVKRVPWSQAGRLLFETDVLGVRFFNTPETRAESTTAKGLSARFTCMGEDVSFPWIDGRLDYSPEPSVLPKGVLPQIEFDLGVNKWREVNLVIKEPDLDHCFMFNNDSYNYPFNHFQKPEWRMNPGEYRIRVKIDGIEVETEFECIFTNHGKGTPLEIKSFKQLTSRQIKLPSH